jgi:plastocyanin
MKDARTMMMKPITAAMLLAFAGGSLTAAWAAQSISQKGKAFSAAEITVKAGEAVTFVNDDTVTHNVMSTSAGNTFNLGPQAPGASAPATFKAAGEAMVTCAIHPHMKLKVTVAN